MRKRRSFAIVAAAVLCAAYAMASPKDGLDKNTVASSEHDLHELVSYFQDTANAIGGVQILLPQGSLERIYRGDQDSHLGFTWADGYDEYRVLVPREDAASDTDKDNWLMINLKPKQEDDDGLGPFEVGVVACDGGQMIVLEKGAKVDVQIDREHHLAQVSWRGTGVSGGEKREFAGKLLARIAFKGESAIFAWREE